MATANSEYGILAPFVDSIAGLKERILETKTGDGIAVFNGQTGVGLTVNGDVQVYTGLGYTGLRDPKSCKSVTGMALQKIGDGAIATEANPRNLSANLPDTTQRMVICP
ncbi:hypothetical protein [Bradyrhizobium sp.]